MAAKQAPTPTQHESVGTGIAAPPRQACGGRHACRGGAAAAPCPAHAAHQVLQQRVAQHLQLGGLVQLQQLRGNRRASMHLARLELRRQGGEAAGGDQRSGPLPLAPMLGSRPVGVRRRSQGGASGSAPARAAAGPPAAAAAWQPAAGRPAASARCWRCPLCTAAAGLGGGASAHHGWPQAVSCSVC